MRDGGDAVEALSVEIFVSKLNIRCCVAYGVQENDTIENKDAFWNYMDEEVLEATNNKSGLLMHFDGNLWAGKDVVPNDPRPQNRNGKLFEQFLERNSHLTVVNSLDLCEGLITRERNKNGKLEQSVLDFFVVCNLLLPYVKKMVIDEDRKFILTNYEQVQKGGKAADTDHMTEYMDLDLKVETEKPERRELWNFKNKEAQKVFKDETTNTSEFSECFKSKLPVLEQIKNWRIVFSKHCRTAFKKVRVTNKMKVNPIPADVSKLIDRRNELAKNVFKTVDDKVNEANLDEIISNKEAELKRNQIVKQFKSLSEDPENVNLNQVWKTLNRLCPRVGGTLPTAKKNHKGRIVSAPGELKKLLAKEYKERLRSRPSRPDLYGLSRRRRRIFRLKLKLAEENTTSSWTMDDLETALQDLKPNKSRDPEGLVNELFKKESIGEDLKLSLLLMFNRLKKEKMLAKFMNLANITTVPKRGSRIILENERGIFRVHVLRFIMMRMIYNGKYPDIDRKMSDCQMGGRKQKGCRNNIFIINGIIHDIMSSKQKNPAILQFYDYRQMFDAINLEQALSDLYDCGVDDDNLAILYRANTEIEMAVNTPSGLSERQTIKDVVLQGETWGSIMASVQVDSIGKEMEQSDLGYKYKNILPVTMLGLVDDIIGITNAGYKAQQMNVLLNVKTAEKRLQFGATKCKSMFVGKNPEAVLNSPLKVDSWKVEHEDNPVTGESELVETYEGLVTIGQAAKYKYLGFMISSSGDNMENIIEMKKKSTWIIRKIFNRLDLLNLKQYYFECGLIFLNVMLRSSILYACEAYYNLKENEVRQLERIEENFLRKLFKTTSGCPISQLYLEAGHTPARYEAKRMRLLFLKYILNEKPESLINKFLHLQFEQPTRGDWASSCVQDLKELKIELSLKEIENMSKSKFNNLIKISIQTSALEYLLGKQGSKGKDITYSKIKMAEYLLPCDTNLTIEQKRYVFGMRNRMLPIPSNFPSKEINCKCFCGQTEDMRHIYESGCWDDENNETPYEKVYSENISELKKVYIQFKVKFEKREEFLSKKESEENHDGKPPHVIPVCDPLSSVLEFGN